MTQARKLSWLNTLAVFNDRNIGHSVSVSVLDSSFRVESEINNVKLCGAAYEPHDGSVEILLEENPDHHVTHSYPNVESLDVLIPDLSGPDVLELRFEDGIVIVSATEIRKAAVAK